MSAQELTCTSTLQLLPMPCNEKGTSWLILPVRLAAGAPMVMLDWVACPNTSAGLPPVDTDLLPMEVLTAGPVWPFLLVMIIFTQDEGDKRLCPQGAVSGITTRVRQQVTRRGEPCVAGFFLALSWLPAWNLPGGL
jgi:hypothetical protein